MVLEAVRNFVSSSYGTVILAVFLHGLEARATKLRTLTLPILRLSMLYGLELFILIRTHHMVKGSLYVPPVGVPWQGDYMIETHDPLI